MSAFARVRPSHPQWLVVSLLAVVCGCVGDRSPEGSPPSAVPIGIEAVAAQETEKDSTASATPATAPAPAPSTASAVELPPDDGSRPTFQRPEHVRALYLNAWAAGSRKRLDELIEIARRTEINAFVIDIKDASGYISHPTEMPVAREIGATGEIRIRDLRGVLRKLEAAGIYPIARIVIVRDPVLSAGRPSLAVQDASGGVWHDEKGIILSLIHI